MDAERRILRDAAIVIQGNSIAAVGKSSEIRPAFPDEPVRDLRGWVVTPGLVDGHIHLPQAILRGCGDEVPLWVWMAERIFILEGSFTAEDARISMRLAALEMLKAGTTAFLETLILGRHALDDLAEAVLATGMRAVLPRAITDGGGYLDESPLSEGLNEAPEVAIADALELAKVYRDSERIRIWFGPRSTGGISEELMREVVALARSEGLGLCQHYAMTVRERDWIRARYGLGQAEFAERVGMLGPDVVLVHACALEPDDIALMRGTGTSVVHCPTGPAKMGSGVTPVHLLHSAGINVSLGHRRRGREQRRRPHARPQVGRLPAEAAARRSDRDDLRGRVRDGDAGRRARARARGDHGLDRAGQARRPDRDPHGRAELDARSLSRLEHRLLDAPAPMSTP